MNFVERSVRRHEHRTYAREYAGGEPAIISDARFSGQSSFDRAIDRNVQHEPIRRDYVKNSDTSRRSPLLNFTLMIMGYLFGRPLSPSVIGSRASLYSYCEVSLK